MLRMDYAMTGTGPAMFGQGIMAKAALEVDEIESRFGRVSVSPAQAIYFPSGMLGMPDKLNYCLTHFPSPKMNRFKLLQSLDDAALSFITLPVDLANPIVERVDLEQAAADLGMPIQDVAVLFVVTIHRDVAGMRLTINARAPILVNTAKRTAAQYVFANTKYQIRQPLAL